MPLNKIKIDTNNWYHQKFEQINEIKENGVDKIISKWEKMTKRQNKKTNTTKTD